MTNVIVEPKVKLKPGEELCPDCPPGRIEWCVRCNGTGKLDWVSRAVEKPNNHNSLGGQVLSVDVNSMYPTIVSVSGDITACNIDATGELHTNSMSLPTLELIEKHMEQKIKEEVDKRISELLATGVLIPGESV